MDSAKVVVGVIRMRRLRRMVNDVHTAVARRSAVLLTLVTALAQAVMFVLTLVLARLYTPGEFGTFAVFLAINTLLLPIVTLRYEWAIPTAASDEEASDVLGLSMSLAVAGGLVLGCIASQLMTFVQGGAVNAVGWWLTPTALILVSLNTCMQFYFVRQNDFTSLSRIRFTFLTAPVFGQVILGFIIGGVDGLLIGYISGQGLNVLLSFIYCRKAVLGCLQPWSFARLLAVAKTYRRFGMFSAPATLAHIINMQLPVTILPSLFGLGVAGHYALAQRVTMQPIYLLSHSIQMAFWGAAARAIREDAANLCRLFLKTSAAVALLLIPALAIAPFAPWLFVFIFGDAWQKSGVYAGILLVPAITQILAHGTSCLHILGHNKWQMYISVGQLLTSSLVFAVAWRFTLDPLTTIFGIAASGLLAHLILWGCNAYVLHRRVNFAAVDRIEANGTLDQASERLSGLQ